ncbi:MAG: altronate dehydratase family protein [Planctomycetota bacterium]|nr:altronate dehydratase family protein [Planctomycetota bacterium]
MPALNSDSPILTLHPDDNIVIARVEISEGTSFSARSKITTQDHVPFGHKIATTLISSGQPIRKFGQVIGFATEDITPGQWVHTHNVTPGELDLDYAFASEIPADPTPITGRTFQGILRPDGRVATRNYIAIISTVNCSATSSKYVAANFDQSILADYPNIDGVLALTHKEGCAYDYGGDQHQLLARTLAGFAKHANIAAYVVLGLGCETAQASFLADNYGLAQLGMIGDEKQPRPLIMNIQDVGGVRKTVERATSVIRDMLPEVNRIERVPVPVSELMLGCECGGSDGNSGITANPAVGIASDLLVAHGATSILAETPEICGGEHLLTRRAVSREVGQKLIDLIDWWKEYAAKFGGTIDNNPSVGNKKGGLTTIYEKSLGAIAKGGSTALKGVYNYAEPITQKGFVVMDSPGFDPVSVTGMVASGANVAVFTTGRGSCFGCKPVPCIKIATNTPMYERMSEDMDINAGRILDGASVEEVGQEIFEKIISVASGEQTKSEAQGIGDEEFCPWTIGPLL